MIQMTILKIMHRRANIRGNIDAFPEDFVRAFEPDADVWKEPVAGGGGGTEVTVNSLA